MNVLKPTLYVKRLNPDATIPTKAYKGDSGFDFVCLTDLILQPHMPTLVPTGLAFQIPEGYEIQVRARSSMASKGVMVANGPGTVDQAYQGEVSVVLINGSWNIVRIPKGSKIAQGVLSLVPTYDIVPTQEFTDASERGDKGFGSSDSK